MLTAKPLQSIIDYFDNGTFLINDGAPSTEVVKYMHGMFLGSAIDYMWRRQKVFIIGGYRCHDTQGLGKYPEDGTICDDEHKAWSLYHWETTDNGTHSVGVIAPHGLELLGKGHYSSVTLHDIISSSVASYKAAGYGYTVDMATERLNDEIESGKADIWSPSRAGIFTIPVCDIGLVLQHGSNDIDQREKILREWGEEDDHEPQWCGPICNWDHIETEAWLDAAHLLGWDKYRDDC